MDETDRELRIVEAKWEEKPGNGYLLRQLFDLLLGERDLTDGGKCSTMPLRPVEDEEGGEA